jgi:hypothetical protein
MIARGIRSPVTSGYRHHNSAAARGFPRKSARVSGTGTGRHSRHDLEELRAALTGDLERWAEHVVGMPPNRAMSNRSELRFRRKGALDLELRGAKRGVWRDHETGQGGGVLDLAPHVWGCSFAEGVARARSWAGLGDGGTPAAPVDRTRLEQEREARAAARLAEAEAEDAKAIAAAQRLWAESLPIAPESPGEIYLTRGRAIPRPAAGWPAALRWHHLRFALVLAATTASGAVEAVQLIHLSADGTKVGAEEMSRRRLPAVKLTRGRRTGGAAVRLPGARPTGPLILAEGPEDGLTAWTASGAEVWITLGAIGAKPVVRQLPTDRQVLVARDGDAPDSPAAIALDAAIGRWREAGHDVREVFARDDQAGGKFDVNDLLRQQGIDAVRARIDAALRIGSPRRNLPDAAPALQPRPHYRRPELTGDRASYHLNRAVRAFFRDVVRVLVARDWIAAQTEREAVIIRPEIKRRASVSNDIDAEGIERRVRSAAGRRARRRALNEIPALHGWGNAQTRRAIRGEMPRAQIAGSAGLGKTTVFAAVYVELAAPGGPLHGRHLHAFVPDHVLAADLQAEIARAWEAAGHTSPAPVRVIHGRGAENCQRHKLAAEVGRAGLSVFRSLCETPANRPAEPPARCPFFNTCRAGGYLRQFTDKTAGLIIMPHARTDIRMPADLKLPDPDVVAVDEGLINQVAVHARIEPITLTATATFDTRKGEIERIEAGTKIGAVVLGAITADASLDVMRAAGIGPDQLRAAAATADEAFREAAPSVSAALSDATISKRLAAYRAHPGASVAGVLRQLARDIEGGRAASVGIEWDSAATALTADGTRVPHPVVWRHHLAELHSIPSNAAVLLLDADANLGINRRVFGAPLRELRVEAARTARVVQIHDAALTDTTVAPGPELPNNHEKAAVLRARIKAFVEREATAARVLVVANKTVRRALTSEGDDLAPFAAWAGAEITHYGRHRGVDRWRDFDVVILVGRLQLPPREAERIAKALYAEDPDVNLTDLTSSYIWEERSFDMRDGSHRTARVQVHPNPLVQSIVELHRERALGQGADRLRLIHRRADNPGRVIVLSNLPIPGLTVDELLSLDDVLAGGTPIARAFAASGRVLPLSPAWLRRRFPELFGSVRTAERDVAELLKDKPPFGNIDSYCRMAVYRLPGQRRPSRALVGSDVSEAAAKLADHVGAEILDFRLFDAPMATTSIGSADQPAAEPVLANPVQLEPDGPGPEDELCVDNPNREAEVPDPPAWLFDAPPPELDPFDGWELAEGPEGGIPCWLTIPEPAWHARAGRCPCGR